MVNIVAIRQLSHPAGWGDHDLPRQTRSVDRQGLGSSDGDDDDRCRLAVTLPALKEILNPALLSSKVAAPLECLQSVKGPVRSCLGLA